MAWRYKVEGSNDGLHWVLLALFETRSKATIRLENIQQSAIYSYPYYRIRELWRSIIARIIKYPFIWISKKLSYIPRPIAKRSFKNNKEDALYSLNDFSTHISKETRFLVATMFPVVMRLFKSSGAYKKLILDSLDYMMELTTRQYKDYPEVKGISGANVGIPFNLVVVKVCEIGQDMPKDLREITIKYKGHHFLHMINPKVGNRSIETFKTTTNCGSLRLERSIKVERHDWILVSFYNRKGKKYTRYIGKPITGTVQHEIDHNNGTLITDREIKTSIP